MENKRQLLLDENDVKYVLERNRDYIGRKVLFGFDSLIAGIGFGLTVIASDFPKSHILKYSLILLSLVYLLWGMRNIFLYYQGKPFNKDILFQQLEDINQMEKHPHSIILIKDDFNKNPNRFLLYYDSRWECKLFVNFHTLENSEDDNIKNIKSHVQAELKTAPQDCAYLFDKVHSKYSASAKREKYYHHKFYRLVLSDNDVIHQDNFTMDGKNYFWMSIAQMESDENIMAKNKDIVGFVKEANI